MSFFEPPIKAPVAQQREHVRRIHGTETADPWYWLRDSDDPEVVAYLSAENAYTDYATAHLAALRAKLYCQLRDRISETHDSLAVPKGPWEYFTRTVAGLAYPIYLRRPRGAGDRGNGGSSADDGGAGSSKASEMVLLDVNALASGHEYFAIGNLAVSPNQHLLAYTADSTGNELYELFVVDLQTGQMIDHSGSELTYGLAWANDDHTLFTVGVDKANRADRVQRHVVGATPGGADGAGSAGGAADDVVFQEHDERFWVTISKTRSERFVALTTESVTTSECHLIDADYPTVVPTLVRARRSGVEYRVDHHRSHLPNHSLTNSQDRLLQDRLLIVTNDGGAENFCLMEASLHDDPVSSESPSSVSSGSSRNTAVGDWRLLIEHRQDTRLEDVDCFESFVVIQERTNGTSRLRLLRSEQLSAPQHGPLQDPQIDPKTLIDLALPAPTAPAPTVPTLPGNTSSKPDYTSTPNDAPYEITPADNLEYDTNTFRYEFTSMTTPPSVFESVLAIDGETAEIAAGGSTTVTTEPGEPHLLYQSPVANEVDLTAYQSVRLWAEADDKTQIPISVVWRPDAVCWPAPCLLYGYGAYEVVIPATFSPARISLLDRGAVFAIAHVRGGGELGRAWYNQGHLQHKQNTFDDFAACARHLIAEGWTEPARLVARGASAGGLLMGAIVNQAPELFAGVVAEVPFVDVVNTMLDPSIPLTVTEFDEWGDPSQADRFETMRSYAPYENVESVNRVVSTSSDENRPVSGRASKTVRPALLVTAGLHDSRVPYWEPAKWVAKLRATSSNPASPPSPSTSASPANPVSPASNTRPILLRTQMSVGHGGASGRYDSWRDEAFVQAFVLAVMGLTN